MRATAFATSLMCFAACTPAKVSVSAPSVDPGATMPEAMFCERAARPGAASAGAIVRECEGVGAEGAPAACQHFRVEGGELVPLELPSDVRVALPAGEGVVLLHPDGRLVLRTAAGEGRALASRAFAPAISADGATLAYLRAEDGVALEDGLAPPGATLEVVLHPLEGVAHVLARDMDAAEPFPLPSGDGALFVSTRTGVASLFRADRDGALVQLTNLDLDGVAQEFVPVPADELVWVPGTSRAVYTVREHDGPTLYEVDADTGATRELGPGHFPAVTSEGVRVALPHVGDGRCARVLPFEVAS